MALQKHSTMVDSEIAWLGNIPEQWKRRRAKYLFKRVQDKPHQNDTVVTAFRDGEVIARNLRRADGFTFADKEIGYQHVERGDLVIHAMDAFAGAIGVSLSAGKMSPVCSICRPADQSTSAAYYAYLLRAMTKTNYLVAIAKGIRERSTDFRYKDFGNMVLPIPDDESQVRIVNYINEEVAKIDHLIERQEKLLTLLEEKRRATVTRAVTRGLNPDTALQETNIPWLDKIPKYWDVMRLKYLFSINDKTLGQKTDPKFEFEYVDISSVDMYRGIIKKETMVFESAPSRARRIVREGDIIVGAVRTYLEAIAQIGADSKDLVVSTGFAVLHPNDARDSDFYSFAIRSSVFMASVVSNSDGVSYPAINADRLASLAIALPPKNERADIAAHLHKEMAQINMLKHKINNQITLLKERRISLISHAVTGKIKI